MISILEDWLEVGYGRLIENYRKYSEKENERK